MNTKEIKEILQAYIDGGVIEFKGISDHKWYERIHNVFDFDRVLYRIKPKPSLEDRVKAEYSDFDVVLLEWQANILCLANGANFEHIAAQSMKGFAGYVYFENDELYLKDEAIFNGLHPIAALFSRGAE